MRRPLSLLPWVVAALLLLLAWLTVTGRLGTSRHGYAGAAARCGGAVAGAAEPPPHSLGTPTAA